MKDLVIGYGSLMYSESRKRSRLSSDATPIEVKGFERGWHVKAHRLPRTYLGAIAQEESSLNAVIFPATKRELRRLDLREGAYHREKISHPDYPHDTIWIYVSNENEIVHTPVETHPVNRWYVDEVIQGCLEQGTSFTTQFIASTLDWKQYWKDNRVISGTIREEIDKLTAHFYPPYYEFQDAQ